MLDNKKIYIAWSAVNKAFRSYFLITVISKFAAYLCALTEMKDKAIRRDKSKFFIAVVF